MLSADKLPDSMKTVSDLSSLLLHSRRRQAGGGEHDAADPKSRISCFPIPYESMEPFLQLIKEAAFDPAVMTIKITIYRLARKARLVEYLCAAAENGKEVTVLIELQSPV